MKKLTRKIILLLVNVTVMLSTVNAQRKMENLGRGVVAVRTGTSTAFVSWRLLGNDPYGTGFNIYRSTGGATAVKLNSSVLTSGTNFTDNTANLTQDNTYSVKPVLNGTEQASSGAFTLTANHLTEPCVVIPIRNGNAIHFVWVGDLDGDGEYDYLVDRLDWTNGGVKIEAYKRDGTYLWTLDMGPNSKNMDNISPGSSTLDVGNWDGLTVYDMDGDGKAEVMVRTANGVIFGDGVTLTNSNDNIQFISVLNGITGAERARFQLPADYLSVGPLACSLGIGYLNGITPSLVGFMKNRNGDGSFNRLMCAWDFDGTTISQKWKNNLVSAGSDGHQMRILDFDGDGKDDIGEIGFVIKNDGTLLYSLADQNVYHGDRWHVGKLDPDRTGLQGYGIQQDNITGLLEYYYDAGTGKVLWKHTSINVGDVGRGNAGDIDPNYPGYEVWSFSGIYNGPTNTLINTPSDLYPSLRMWWDGDLFSESYNDGKIEKHLGGRLVTTWNYHGASSSDRGAPQFYGDILGDWREEAILSGDNNSSLVIFTTPIPTNTRIYTLPHNPEYRNCMTVKGYYQSNMLDYYLGHVMSTPPTPPMQTAKCIWKGNYSNNVWDVANNSNWIVNGTSGPYTQGDDVMFDISGAPDTTVLLDGALSPSSLKVISSLNYYFDGSGTLSGSMGILKSGNGNLSLNINCDHTDTTRVEEGGVFVNANLTQSPVLVHYGAKLGGAGTISKSAVLNTGAIVEPGTKGNVGTLTFNSGLTLPTRGKCLFDITDDSTGLIKPSDKIAVTGNLIISDTLTIEISKINDKAKAGTYPLITYTGSFSGNLTKIGITGLFGQKFSLSNGANTIYLKIEAARAASKIVWNGLSDTWDLQTTPAWTLKGLPVTFVSNDTVIIDQNGSNNPIVKVIGSLTAGNVTVDASANNYSLTGTGNIGGPAGLTKTGQGTLSLLTTNSYTGKTLVNAGKLEINKIADAGANSSIGANASSASSELVFNNAYLKYSGPGNGSTNKGLTINGVSDTIEVTNSSSMLTIQGVITGTGNLVKTGPGILNLQLSSNTFAGNTIIKGGTLSLGDQIANSSGLNNGTVTLDNGTFTIFNNSSSNEFYTSLTVPVESTGYFNTGQRVRLRGILTGGGNLNVYLPGNIDRTIFFGDWSTFTGTINFSGVASSSFRIANIYGYAGATINLTANVTMYHGGTGTTAGNSTAETVQIGALSGTTGSTIKDENWTIGAKNTDATFNGTITGASITKVGTGSWTLTGANTYTGGTTVNGGTLIVKNTTGSGTGTGAVTVNNSATLAGTGTIAGAVTIANGGAIAPGNNGIGSLVINNNLVLSAGSTTAVEVNKTSTCDTIRLTGSITFNGTLAVTNTNAVALAAGDSYKLFKATTYRGSFASITPAEPGLGLVWDTTALRISGTIKVKATQTITFDPLANKTFGDAAFTLTGTASSGLALTYASSDPSVATISGNTATITGAGSVTITASQNGDASYLPASNVAQTLVVDKASQTISFSDLPSKKVGDDPFSLTATSSSGLPVSYTSSNTGVITISGSTVTIAGTGTTNITASQAGNNNYNAAADVVKPLDITATGVVSLTEREVSIAPNPVSDALTVTLRIPETETTIEIYTLSGVQVYNELVTDKITTIPISLLKSGLYLIKVTSLKGVMIKQIIKQ